MTNLLQLTRTQSIKGNGCLPCAPPIAVQKATIPVEQTQGAILLISGGDDQFWPSSELCERVIERLRQHQHPYPFLHLQYPHAGHGIGLPHLPATVNQLRHPIRRLLLRSGGTARENARARVDAWARTVEFLRENLVTGASSRPSLS